MFYNLRIFDLFHLEIKNKLLFRIAHRDFRHVTLNIKSIFFGLEWKKQKDGRDRAKQADHMKRDTEMIEQRNTRLHLRYQTKRSKKLVDSGAENSLIWRRFLSTGSYGGTRR